jgi:hypothetical protein
MNSRLQIFFLSSLLYSFIESSQVAQVSRSFISIRGHPQSQRLPISHTKHWDVYTYDFNDLNMVESQNSEDGWIYPTSFDTLYLPSDLPRPVLHPALGVVLVHGSPRYIMPSIITTLETPDRIWRNRGICSLPRAHAWIDLFAPFTPKLSDLKFSLFQKSAPDVRFLEDQDGSEAWESMIEQTSKSKPVSKDLGLFRPIEESSNNEDKFCLDISTTYQQFLDELNNNQLLQSLKSEGFRIIDIPLPYEPPSSSRLFVPRGQQVRAYLTDFVEPERLLAMENPESLENEPCGELDINLVRVSEGRSSKFLPAVYRDLFEEGAVIFS